MPLPTIFNNPNAAAAATGHGGDDAIIIDDDDGGDGAMQIDSHGHGNGPAGLQHQHGHQRQQRQRVGFEGYNPSDADPTTAPLRYSTSIAREKRIRSKLREGRHAALCVLMDRELLMVQALAAHETIPQTRRRFLAQLMAPDDPAVATALRADRFTLLPPASTHASTIGPRTIVDVHETDDAGWYRPDQSSSKTNKGKTPERDRDRERAKARTSLGGRQTQQHRERERERRRRWSGGERDRWGELDVDIDIE